MNLRARVINGRLMLCDTKGDPLPGQRDVMLCQPFKAGPTTITVTFVVDGQAVSVGDTIPC